jgi:hypothetical protein
VSVQWLITEGSPGYRTQQTYCRLSAADDDHRVFGEELTSHRYLSSRACRQKSTNDVCVPETPFPIGDGQHQLS